MQADYSVELGREDPILELPWSTEDGGPRYYDLKRYPDLILNIPEAVEHPELSIFLSRINAASLPLLTAKCDVWTSHDLAPEEQIFGGSCKFASYIDVAFTAPQVQTSFAQHEKLAMSLCDLLVRVPEMAAAIEFAIRRCYYHRSPEAVTDANITQTSMTSQIQETPEATSGSEGPLPSQAHDRAAVLVSGFYITVYVSGFGGDQHHAHNQWMIALNLAQNALVQTLARP